MTPSQRLTEDEQSPCRIRHVSADALWLAIAKIEVGLGDVHRGVSRLIRRTDLDGGLVVLLCRGHRLMPWLVSLPSNVIDRLAAVSSDQRVSNEALIGIGHSLESIEARGMLEETRM